MARPTSSREPETPKGGTAEQADFRQFFDLSLDMLCIAGFDGYFKHINSAWERTLGFSFEELTERPYLDFIHPDDLAATNEKAAALSARGDKVLSFANRYRCKDGSYKWLLWNAMPLPEQGLIYAVAHDITEQRATQDALTHLAFIIEASDDAIMSWAPDGTILTWNPGAERLYGYSATEAVGAGLDLILPARSEGTLASMLARIEAGERVSHYETERMRRDRTTVEVSLALSAIRNQEGTLVGVSAIARDITQQKEAQRIVADLAYKDPLTGLPNRRLLYDRLALALASAKRRRESLALLSLDLDGFKGVNDRLGHAAGDEVLRVVGERISGLLRETDTLSRIGGDEFVVVLPDVNVEEGASVASRILAEVRKPIELTDSWANVSTSIGIAMYPSDGADIETLLRKADSALYRAKDSGRDNLQVVGALQPQP